MSFDIGIIRSNLKTRENSKLRNAMGVDVGFKELNYVLDNHFVGVLT